jgi:hypothetical protein
MLGEIEGSKRIEGIEGIKGEKKPISMAVGNAICTTFILFCTLAGCAVFLFRFT